MFGIVVFSDDWMLIGEMQPDATVTVTVASFEVWTVPFVLGALDTL